MSKTRTPVKRAAKKPIKFAMTLALAEAIREWGKLKRRVPEEAARNPAYPGEDGSDGVLACFARQIREGERGGAIRYPEAVRRAKSILAILRAVDAIAKGGA